MYKNTKDTIDHGGEKVTIYTISPLGMSVLKIEARLHETGLRNRTTYATKSVPYATFTPKRKRKKRSLTVEERSPYLLIIKGWGGPEPAGMWGEGTTDPATGVTTSRGLYGGFDPRWSSDFNEIIDPAIESGSVEVVLDARDESSFGTPVEVDAPKPGGVYALTAFSTGGPSIAAGSTWEESRIV